jgi:hypothetical protein
MLCESVGHLGVAMAWQKCTALIVQSGEIVRLVGVLSAVTAETSLYEGLTSVAAGVLFDFFSRAKLR